MYKYLLAIFLLVSVSVFADTGGIYTTDTKSFSDYPTAAKCAGHASDSEVQLIDETSDWSTINDSGVYYYCVEPGDYVVDVSITKSCTVGQRCYIWHYDVNEAAEIHPALMDEADRSIITNLNFLDLSTVESKYWVVDRLTVRDIPGGLFAVRIEPDDSENIILSRILVEESGRNSVGGGGDFNLIQNSVVRNSEHLEDNLDSNCISFYGADYKVIGNELYDCEGDGILVSPGADGGIIAENEIYITSAKYSDAGTGNLNPDGVRMCAENAIDFKGGALIADEFPFASDEWLLVADNRFYGYNRGDSPPCVSGGNTIRGPIITSHDDAEGFIFQDNVIWGGENHIDTVGFLNTSSDFTRHAVIINNLIYDTNYATELPQPNAYDLEFHYNTLMDSNRAFSNMDGGDDILCNVIINIPSDGPSSVGGGTVFDYNSFYNSDNDVIGNTNDYVGTWDTDSKNEMFCWPRNHITGLRAQCVAYASTTVESPHADICNAPPEQADIGVDEISRLTRVRGGFVAPYLQRTMEYEESSDGTFNFVAPIKDNYQFWFRATTTDADDNTLSFSVDERGNNILSFAHPATEWRKAKVNINLNAGLHTLAITERETGIVIDKMIVTNNPEFVSP